MKSDPTIDRLTQLFFAAAGALDAIIAARLKEIGVSPNQYSAMMHLGNAESPLTMSQLSEKMGHTTAAATGLVDRLTALGYVTRGTAAGDRRRVTVDLTTNGADVLSDIYGIGMEFVRERVGEFDSEDMAELTRFAEMIGGAK